VKRLSLLTFFGAAKESKCRPAQGSKKIKNKSTVKPALTQAEGNQTARASVNQENRN
jgi:hypothetical protein